jgi:hypothetical protein
MCAPVVATAASGENAGATVVAVLQVEAPSAEHEWEAPDEYALTVFAQVPRRARPNPFPHPIPQRARR